MKTLLILFMLLISFNALSKEGEFHAGVSYLYSQMSYKEPGIMSEKGKLTGFAIETRYDFSDLISANLQGKFLGGNLEYDGATFSGTPLKQTTKDTVREYRGLVYFNLGDFSPYSGYGYRYWKNDLVISYVRETTYHYIPVGLRYMVRPFYLSFERRQFLRGVNISHMSDVAPNRSDVTLKQNSGESYALEAGLLGSIASLDYKVSLMYEYWKIKDSKPAFDGVNTLIEPHNSTNTLTLSVGLFY